MAWNDSPNEVEIGESNPPTSKTTYLELNVTLNKRWALEQDQIDYANRFIQNFAPTQTITKRILDKNLVATNIKGKHFLDLYLREFMVE